MTHDETPTFELRPIPGHAGYFAGSDGRVYSSRRGEPTPLKGRVNKHTGGYVQVNVREDCGRRTYKTVHTLVAAAFHGPRPDGLTASHINDVQTDNRPKNLCWESFEDNLARTTFARSLSDEQIEEFGAALLAGATTRQLMARFDISRATTFRYKNVVRRKTT